MVGLTEILGGALMAPPDLLKEIHKAGWPAKVLVDAPNFFALTMQMGMPLPEREEDGTPYFWVGRTKVTTLVAPPGMTNLTKWAPSLIEAHSSGLKLVK